MKDRIGFSIINLPLLLKNSAVYLFIFLFIVLLVIGWTINFVESQRSMALLNEEISVGLGKVRGALENRLYSNIHKAEGIKALVAMNPNLTQDDFKNAMEIYFRDQSDLRNIGLAPDMIIKYVYPLEGNQAAIGLDFRTVPSQFETADLARKLNKIVVAGPFELVQGGMAIVARIPIYINDIVNYPDGFWGLASVVLNLEILYRD